MADRIKLNFRLPPELHRELTKRAKMTERSLNAEIIFRLKKSIEFENAKKELADRVNQRKMKWQRQESI